MCKKQDHKDWKKGAESVLFSCKKIKNTDLKEPAFVSINPLYRGLSFGVYSIDSRMHNCDFLES
jgi:hypothetical protein